MRIASSLGLSTLLLVGACIADEGTLPGAARSPILGGTAASVGQYPTVVAQLTGPGGCTGTLVWPDIVLTAAHCVTPSVLGYATQEQVTADTTIVLDTADIFSSAGRQIQAAATIPHPQFNVNALGDNDIGIIRLAEDVTDRQPTVINRVAAAAPVGIALTQVGYGLTDPYDQYSAGRLYALVAKVTTSCSIAGESDALLLCYSQQDGSGKCSGDSGGPSFADVDGQERVVGVTTFGDQYCQYFGADTRTDAELEFLDSVAPELQCQTDGVCNESCGAGGLPPDGDCPTCSVDADCGDPDLECVDDQCQPRPETPGGLGWECTVSQDCFSGTCYDGPDGLRCTIGCTDGGGECPSGFDCLVETGWCWPGGDDDEEPGVCVCQLGGGTGPREAAGGALLALLALATVARRRRR